MDAISSSAVTYVPRRGPPRRAGAERRAPGAAALEPPAPARRARARGRRAAAADAAARRSARDVAVAGERGAALPARRRRRSRSSAASSSRCSPRSPPRCSSTTSSSRRCTRSTSPTATRPSRWPCSSSSPPLVSGAVELATRRARAAEQAAQQAETLSALAGAELDETETLQRRPRAARAQTFGMESVVAQGARPRVAASGSTSSTPAGRRGQRGAAALRRADRPRPAPASAAGPALFAEDQRVLRGVRRRRARPPTRARRLSEQAREARALADVDRQRTALLAAVGHDLRTPLAGIKAAVSSLRQTDVDWSAEERDELLATIEDSADRLDARRREPARRQPPAGRRAGGRARAGRARRGRRRRAARRARRGRARSSSTCPRTCRWSAPTPGCSSGCSPT